MADWTTLDTNTLLPGEPLTSAIALALEENPRAIAEQATGAPKIADKTEIAEEGTTTFASIDTWGGLWVHTNVAHVSGGPAIVRVSFSDDGSTFSGNTDIAGVDAGEAESGTAFFDFSSGVYRLVRSGVHGGVSTSGNVGAISGTATHVRVEVGLSGGGAVSGGCILRFQGGESAS